MPDALELLQTRRSLKPIELVGPGPSAAEIETLLTIASRVPDHGKLVQVGVARSLSKLGVGHRGEGVALLFQPGTTTTQRLGVLTRQVVDGHVRRG